MKAIQTYSREGLLNPPIDSEFEENPPVAIVVIAWIVESKNDKPQNQYIKVQTEDRIKYKIIISVAKLAVLGISFSDESDPSSLNSCIPPTPRFGKIETALTIIPIPPSHCKRLRHTIIPSETLLRSLIIVEPVVVKPETDSKKASVKLNILLERRNGIEEKTDKIIQLSVTIRKAPLVLSLFSFPREMRKNINPKKLVMTALIRKSCQPRFP